MIHNQDDSMESERFFLFFRGSIDNEMVGIFQHTLTWF